jgi:hypothetical protein
MRWHRSPGGELQPKYRGSLATFLEPRMGAIAVKGVIGDGGISMTSANSQSRRP